jgi:nucleoside-diphosphate-sugar epimerase
MHILLTGASGAVGSHVLLYLLAEGHRVLAVDLHPFPEAVIVKVSQIPKHAQAAHTFAQCDLTDYKAFEAILQSAQPAVEGVIHLGAIPNPTGHDDRNVHNNNVVGSYNVLKSSALYGVKRIVQASSVNALGLTFTPAEHRRFSKLPISEDIPTTCVSGRGAFDVW